MEEEGTANPASDQPAPTPVAPKPTRSEINRASWRPTEARVRSFQEHLAPYALAMQAAKSARRSENYSTSAPVDASMAGANQAEEIAQLRRQLEDQNRERQEEKQRVEKERRRAEKEALRLKDFARLEERLAQTRQQAVVDVLSYIANADEGQLLGNQARNTPSNGRSASSNAPGGYGGIRAAGSSGQHADSSSAPAFAPGDAARAASAARVAAAAVRQPVPADSKTARPSARAEDVFARIISGRQT